MRQRRYAREDAVGRYMFMDLYIGALNIKKKTRRLAACTLLLATCRLKMRFNEFLHMHEGWYNRQYGVLKIPSFEPCMCKYCLTQSKKNHSRAKNSDKPASYDSAKERFVNERYSSKNARQRYVPVAWSPRIAAALDAYFDEIGAYPRRDKTAKRLLNNYILENARFFTPDDINFHALRGTGETFFAFENIPTKSRAEAGGHREVELGTYSGASPIEMLNQFRKKMDRDPLSFDYYDLAKDSRPHPQEPFSDPREISPLDNSSPYETPPLFNPRTDEQRAKIDMTKSEFVDRSDTLEIVQENTSRPSIDDLKARSKRFTSLLNGNDEHVDPLSEAYDDTDTDDVGPGQITLGQMSNDSDQ